MEKESILGFNVCTSKKEELIRDIFEDYKKSNQIFIVNINPEIVINNYKNVEFKKELNKQKYQIPDGSGIVWASKKKKGNIKNRITGIDLMIEICDISQKYSSKIFLYGTKLENVEKAKEELKLKYPNIKICGVCSGYEEENIALKKIQESDADIVFVGLGSPNQEKFIIKNRDKLKNVKIIMPVGGSLDVISKMKKRAPAFIIKLNLEWLYRLFQEPKRISRQIKLLKYIYLIKKEKRREKV